MNINLDQKKLSDKNKPHICCPYCANALIIRYGVYLRAHPEKQEHVKVQRYLCKVPDCPTKTFSVLDYPFLRYLRHFYPSLERCHCLCLIHRISQAAAAREMGLTRGIIKRLSEFGRKFFPWLDQERKIADWGADFETDPDSVWPNFLRDFSHRFYSIKWGIFLPT